MSISANNLVEFALLTGAILDEDPLRQLPEVTGVRRSEGGYCLTVRAPHITLPALLELLQQSQASLARLVTRHASLEDVFVSLTGRQLQEAEAAA